MTRGPFYTSTHIVEYVSPNASFLWYLSPPTMWATCRSGRLLVKFEGGAERTGDSCRQGVQKWLSVSGSVDSFIGRLAWPRSVLFRCIARRKLVDARRRTGSERGAVSQRYQTMKTLCDDVCRLLSSWRRRIYAAARVCFIYRLMYYSTCYTACRAAAATCVICIRVGSRQRPAAMLT